MSQPFDPLGACLKQLKTFIANPAKQATIVKDIACLQDKDCQGALTNYFGNIGETKLTAEELPYYYAILAFSGERRPDQLDDNAQRNYKAFQAAQAAMGELVDLMTEFGGEIPDETKAALERLSEKEKTAIGYYDENMNPYLKAAMLVGCNTVLGGLSASYFIGQDKSVIPLRLATNIRTHFIIYNWLYHPSSNFKQSADMITQRFIAPSPGQLLLIASLFPTLKGFYGNEIYGDINVSLSLGVVTSIIALQEAVAWWGNRKTRRAIEKFKANPTSPELQLALQTNLGKQKMAGKVAKHVRGQHQLSPGASNQFSRSMTNYNDLTDMIDQLANPRPRDSFLTSLKKTFPVNDPAFREKAIPVAVASAFGAIQAVAARENPVSEGLVLAWTEYTAYRLGKFLTNPNQTPQNQWDLLGQTSGIVPIMLLFQSAPLEIWGKDIFNNELALAVCTSIICVCQCWVAHLTGPLLVASPYAFWWLLKALGRISIKLATSCCKGETAPQQQNIALRQATAAAFSLAYEPDDETPLLTDKEEVDAYEFVFAQRPDLKAWVETELATHEDLPKSIFQQWLEEEDLDQWFRDMEIKQYGEEKPLSFEDFCTQAQPRLEAIMEQ